MDSITTATPQKKHVNIISNVVIHPQVQQTGDIRHLQISSHVASSEESVLFKQLNFDFSSRKRKNDLDYYEHGQNKLRRESNDSDDDETIVFNYLTGSYEKIKTQIKEESPEDFIVPKEECDIDVEEVSIREESFSGIEIADNDDDVEENWANSIKGFSVLENVSLLGNVLSGGYNTESSVNTSNSVPHVSSNSSFREENNSSILECLLKSQTSCPITGIQDSSLEKMKSESPKSKCPANLNGTFKRPGSSLNKKLNSISKRTNISPDVSPNLSPEKITDVNEVADPLELDTSSNSVKSVLFGYLTSNNSTHVATAHSPEEMQSRYSTILKDKHVEEVIISDSDSESNSSIESRFQEIRKRTKTQSDLDVNFKCTHCQFECTDETEWETHQHSHKDDFGSNSIIEASSTVGNTIMKVVVLRDDLHHLQNSINHDQKSTEDPKVNVPIKCFDCDNVFDGAEELKCHASLIHNASAFKCALHSPKHGDRGCGKCLYESLLRSIQKNYVIIECNQENNNKNDAVSDCDLNQSSSSSSTIKTTTEEECNTNRGHSVQEIVIILSDDETEETDSSEHLNGSCLEVSLKDNEQQIVIVPDDTVSNEELVANSLKASANNNNDDANSRKAIENNDVNNKNHKTKENALKLHCFDCDLHVIGDLLQFRCHVVQHIGSKFRCLYHTHYKEEDCSSCCYENILNDIEDYVKRCPTCGFATADAPRLEKHLQMGDGCKIWRERKHVPGELKCFHCQYVTSCKKYLLYHAVDHVHKDFTCKEHCPNKEQDDDCLACTYQHCLEQAKTDSLDCDQCGFRTVTVEVFDVHQCNKINNGKKYRCWDCDEYSTCSFDELREHSVEHYKSSFRCDQHSSITDCSKCVYQGLVESLENSVFACEKCRFKSLSVEELNCHKTKGCCPVTPEVAICGTEEAFQCFHCEYKTNKKNMLTFHCKQHYEDTPFECDQHRESTQTDCPRCLYQSILDSAKKSLLTCHKCNFKTFNMFRLTSHVNRNCDILIEARFPFQCYDCGTAYTAMSSLTEHANVHSYSRFKCMDHKSPVQKCKMCIYENVIKNINDDAKTKLIAEVNPVAIESASGYACFDCDFSHDRLQFLKEHVTVHQSSQFKCDQHQKFAGNCPKCLYVRLLSDVPTNRICCFDCDGCPEFIHLATLHRHVLLQHSDSSFACIRHPLMKVANCGRCLYQNVLKDVLGDKYVTLRCWDCKGKTFQDKPSLQRHIEERHQKSKFACVDHPRGKLKRCSKCCYEETLRQRIGTVSNDAMAIFQCFDCDYSEEKLSSFRFHIQMKHPKSQFKCKRHGRSKPDLENCPQCFYEVITSGNPETFIRCYQSHEGGRPFSSIQNLKKHILAMHINSWYVCPNHTSSISVNCPKCWFQRYLQGLTAAHGSIFQCFECDYRRGRLDFFKMHVLSKHQKSKFKCLEHSDRTDDDCPKCFYAMNVTEIHTTISRSDKTIETVFRCYECPEARSLGGKADLKTHIVNTHQSCVFVCPRHISNSINCGKCWFQRFSQKIMREQRVFFQCLDCTYKTHIFTSFKNHVAKEHQIINFKCKRHSTKQSQHECRKCSYSKMIRNVRPMHCYECETHPQFLDVQTLKSHVNKVHRKSFFVCPEHLSVRDNCNKCFFQIVVKELLNIICCDCDVGFLPVKDDLKRHIKARHLKSSFSCNFHPLLPDVVSCIKCAYEELVQQCVNECASEKSATTTTVNGVFKVLKCFDCNYKAPTAPLMKSHIRNKHLDSTFTCTIHSLGEINNSCLECVYENLVLLLKIE